MAILNLFHGKKYRIQRDLSGQGHNWKNVHKDDFDGTEDEQIIAAEIIDGKREKGECQIVDRHYRWYPIKGNK